MNVQLLNNTFHTQGCALLEGAGWYVYARNNLFSGSSRYGSTSYYSGMTSNSNLDSDYNLYINGKNKPANDGSALQDHR